MPGRVRNQSRPCWSVCRWQTRWLAGPDRRSRECVLGGVIARSARLAEPRSQHRPQGRRHPATVRGRVRRTGRLLGAVLDSRRGRSSSSEERQCLATSGADHPLLREGSVATAAWLLRCRGRRWPLVRWSATGEVRCKPTADGGRIGRGRDHPHRQRRTPTYGHAEPL